VSAAKSVLDRLADPLKADVRNMRYRHLGQPGKSAVVEHTFEIGHNINFSSISIHPG
jgi:hypothetical protein